MNIQSIISQAQKKHHSNCYLSEHLTNELFKAGIYGDKDKFSHFAEICPISFSVFEFGEEKKDKFTTFLHAAIEWFREGDTIELLKKNKIKNLPYKEDYISLCIVHQKLQVLDYFLAEHLANDEDIWKAVLLKDNLSLDSIKQIEPEIIVEKWVNIFKDIDRNENYRLYDLNTSMEKIIPAWIDIEFDKKQKLLPYILIITNETGKHFADLVPYVYTQLIMSRFISLDTLYIDKNNKESMRFYIQNKKEYLLEDALSAHYLFEKEQMNYNLNQNLPDKMASSKVKI